MLEKSASIVLASLRGSMYRNVHLASSLAAALLDGLLSILREEPSPYWPPAPGLCHPDERDIYHVSR